MPGSSENGMLEDLCLKTVKDNPAMKCVNSFIDCAKGLGEPPKNIAKAKAQAYLAAMPKILSSVGIAAQKGYWDLDSIELHDLKTILLAL